MNLPDMDSRAVLELAYAEESAQAVRLLSEIKNKRKKIIEDAEKNPMISDNIKSDIRYQLGYAAGLSWVLSLPASAKKYIESIEEN